jgi:cbb3-type cytochrome oxidase subunit 3
MMNEQDASTLVLVLVIILVAYVAWMILRRY